MAKSETRSSNKGEKVQNAAVDATGAVAKTTGAVVGAAAIGVVKGLTKAVVRSFKR